MKNSMIIVFMVLLAGCSQLSQMASANSETGGNSVRAKMQTCLMREAQTRFQAGTLFNNSVSVTADELISTCAKNLALESAGIGTEARTTATNIITNLKNMSAAQ